ncbi:MAG: hypothetical protein CMK44_05605 [Porticoccus sp.]|nr:hypothetical protein [Porticoccus sp.]
MKQLKFWLISLLLIQLTISGGLFWQNHISSLENKPVQLLKIDWANIDKFTIEDTAGGITIVKINNSWLLSNQQLPVSEIDVTKFLYNLMSLKTGWPVATLEASHDRFKVSDNKFIRRVELFANNKSLGKLLFGTSIGLRQSNVRARNDNNIYNAKLDTLDISANIEDWFDKSLIAASDISKIKGRGYSLKRIGAIWQPDQSGPSILMGKKTLGRLNQNKISELEAAFSNLKILKITGFKPSQSTKIDDKFKIIIVDEIGTWEYIFISSDRKFYVTRNDREEYFSLSKESFDIISATIHEELVERLPMGN